MNILTIILSFLSLSDSALRCTKQHLLKDGSCRIKPDARGKLIENVIITNKFAKKVQIDCRGKARCKEGLRLFSASKGPLDIDCTMKDSCQATRMVIGLPDKIPNGYNRYDFNGRHGKVDIDCQGISSCRDSMIYINGDFPNGVSINALGKDSFVGAQVVCNLKPGQSCRLLCDETTSCKNSVLLCQSNNCKCLGNSCPLTIFPKGKDPVKAKIIGISPNNPSINCIAGTDDNPPDECRFTNIKTSLYGLIHCKENYDCCLCKELQCKDCKSIYCSGDSGCRGVNINVNGNSKQGASVNCNGDLSCEYSVVKGNHITALKADGDLSMRGSKMILNMDYDPKNKGKLPPLDLPCNGDGSCKSTDIKAKNVISVKCNGDNSCEHTLVDIDCRSDGWDKGCSVSCGGDHSCKDSIWKLKNVGSFVCNGDVAAANNDMNITMVRAGGPCICGGDNSCENSKFNVKYVNRMECVGDESCLNSTINVKCVSKGDDKGCPYVCGGDGSCKNSRGYGNNIGGFSCVGESACYESLFDLNCANGPNGCLMRCQGVNSCRKGDFTIQNVRGLICAGRYSCTKAQFKLQCAKKACNVLCQGVNACQFSVFRIKNVKSLLCSGNHACENTTMSLTCNDKIKSGCSIDCLSTRSCYNGLFRITNSGGVRCTRNSCSYAKFILFGNKGGSLNCIGTNSCNYAKFNGIDNVKSIICYGGNSCLESNIIANCDDKGCDISCSGYASCKKSRIMVKHVNEVNCKNTYACQATSMYITTNSDSFKASCNTPNSCKETIIRVKAEPKVKKMIGIECAAALSCPRAVFYIQGNKDDRLEVSQLTCGGMESCYETKFIFRNAVIKKEMYDKACKAPSACKHGKINLECRDINDRVIDLKKCLI